MHTYLHAEKNIYYRLLYVLTEIYKYREFLNHTYIFFMDTERYDVEKHITHIKKDIKNKMKQITSIYIVLLPMYKYVYLYINRIPVCIQSFYEIMSNV